MFVRTNRWPGLGLALMLMAVALGEVQAAPAVATVAEAQSAAASAPTPDVQLPAETQGLALLAGAIGAIGFMSTRRRRQR